MTQPDKAFRRELARVINKYSRENGSDTDDATLANYMADCLAAFDKAVAAREKWYGRPMGVNDDDATLPKTAG